MAITRTIDYVSGQEIVVALFPMNSTSSVVATGLQRGTFTLQDSFEIATDTSGVPRYRDTGPVSCTWEMDRWQIIKEDLPTLLGLTPNSDAVGNYNWKKYRFSFAVNYVLLNADGSSGGSGGIDVDNARINTWVIDMTDPYAIILERITGTGFTQLQQGWK